MIVGRMIAYIGDEYAYVSNTKITKIFVASDVFAILTQGAGGGILAGANGNISSMQLAKKILLIGLALQIITFAVFLYVAVSFHYRSSHARELFPYANKMGEMKRLWIAFYISGFLIAARSIYRAIGKYSFTPDRPVSL